jgi:methylase of polypeptide subunit release factors
LDEQQQALVELGTKLRAAGYRFVTPTPETHRRVLGRAVTPYTASFVDIFGWSRPFIRDAVEPALAALLERAGVLETVGHLLRSTVRFSSLDDLLLVHSAFPTRDPNAVFFGPDTYRFARAITEFLRASPAFAPQTIIDIGAGTGAGGIHCASLFPKARRIILTDINQDALRLADVNAVLNGLSRCECRESDVLSDVFDMAELIISNPPYLVDETSRAYRHGGGDWGEQLALRIVEESLGQLGAGGKLLLYTGTPVVAGDDMFLKAVTPLLKRKTRKFRYAEIDPDVFGQELDNAPYDKADRIAAVFLIVEAQDLKVVKNAP